MGTGQLGTSPVVWSPLKLFQLSHPDATILLTLLHTLLSMENTIKFQIMHALHSSVSWSNLLPPHIALQGLERPLLLETVIKTRFNVSLYVLTQSPYKLRYN